MIARCQGKSCIAPVSCISYQTTYIEKDNRDGRQATATMKILSLRSFLIAIGSTKDGDDDDDDDDNDAMVCYGVLSIVIVPLPSCLKRKNTIL